MTLQNVLAIAGSIALLIGLFGGGVKAKEIEVPRLSVWPRILSSLIGMVLIGIAVRLPNPLQPTESPTLTPISTTELVSAQQPTIPPPPTSSYSPTATPTNSPTETTLTSAPRENPPQTNPPATDVPTPTHQPEDFGNGLSAVMAGDRLTVFARSADGTLTHKYYDGGWTDWIPLGNGQITSAPSAVMAGNRLTVFARSADGTLTHKYYDGGWTDWIPLGDGQMTSAPSAVMAGDRLTVFARSADGTLMHKFYDGGWTDWIPLGTG